MWTKSLLLVLFLTPTAAQAKLFKNSYIQFEMPNEWDCFLHKTAWICRHKISKSCAQNKSNPDCKKQIKASKEAIIIMAAKEKSNIDSIEAYSKHLGEPRRIQNPNGVTSQSQVVHNKKVNIRKLPWVDGMHLSSELPNYYTRYLATIKGQVAVLVTFNAHKKYYTKYTNKFFQSIKSLNVVASKIGKINKNELGNKVLSRPLDIPNELLHDINAPEENQEDEGFSFFLMFLALILAVAGIVIWVRGRK